jgi:DNA-binding response OmpR family regulator
LERSVSGIVVIEKDDLLRGLLKEWLSAEGFAVRERGLSELPAGDRADLVIVDLYMPRHEGREIVRAVKHAHPGAAIIAMSARFSRGLTGSCRAAQALGAQRLIAKPFTREELLEAVRAVIGRSDSSAFQL